MTTFPSAAAVTEAQPEARVAISLTDVSFAYNGVPVLEDVTLAIPEGEFVTVVGPNGGGKTTLLKLILGLLRPSKGQVRVFGEMPQRARSRVGYAPQHMGFDPRFPVTALDVVLMGRLERRLLGGYTKADKRAAVAALGEVELTESWSHPFSALSGGQRQRVLIARAIGVRAGPAASGRAHGQCGPRHRHPTARYPEATQRAYDDSSCVP